jgi:hypothetical protein
MVQMNEVAKIAAAWEAAGQPYCEHKNHEKEHHLGGGTGDYACLDCGLSWPRGGPIPEPRGEPV